MTLTEDAVEMLKAGKTQKQVATTTGLSKGWVCKLAERTRGFVERRSEPKKWGGKKLRSLRRLRGIGLTVKEIALVLGESYHAVNMAVFRWGLAKQKPRTKEEAERAKALRKKAKRLREREANRELCRRLRAVPPGHPGVG
jgi:DNA-binding CsgD family transcriptional regulator